MNTNRELYKSIEQLIKKKEGEPVLSLEVYLSQVIQRAGRYAHQESMNLEDFFCLLRDAFDGDRDSGEVVPQVLTAGFSNWKTEVERQVEDLKQMAQNGQLQGKYRYLGISAPSGEQWYNFDPCTYLECGVEGAFGGWTEGDETGRVSISGDVASVDSDRASSSSDSGNVDPFSVQLQKITWEMFSDFARCGQYYE
ncbi:MAG: hypothetical protein ABI273_03330 [Lacunisphaera sp.]